MKQNWKKTLGVLLGAWYLPLGLWLAAGDPLIRLLPWQPAFRRQSGHKLNFRPCRQRFFCCGQQFRSGNGRFKNETEEIVLGSVRDMIPESGDAFYVNLSAQVWEPLVN